MSDSTRRDPHAAILGLEFRLGQEIPCPGPMGFSTPVAAVLDTRTAWAGMISRAVTADGARGVLRVRPDGAVDLFDARAESLYLATDRAGTVHLLFA